MSLVLASVLLAACSGGQDLSPAAAEGHTGSLYAVDDEGNLLVTWPFGISIDDLTNDLEILLDTA